MGNYGACVRARPSSFAAMTLLLLLAGVYSLDNGLGRTPPLGWSSWNHFGPNINDQILRQAADAMVSSGMRDAGYQYINLDDGWAISRDKNGTIVADPKLFPQGMKSLVDYIHSKGLLFGIYTARGSRTCLGRPGSDSFEQQDADYYAAIGVDYLKEDSCGGTVHGSVWDQYSRMRDALNRTRRPIYYSITQALSHPDKPPIAAMHCYGDSAFTIKSWLAEGKDPRSLANSFLIEYCNNMDFFGYTGGVPRPGGMLSQLDSQALLTFDNMTTKGAYNDMDMLHVCNGGQTLDEYRSQFSLWAVLASPMILGNDIRTMDSDCKAIVLNSEILAISQDPTHGGERGKLVYQYPDAHWPTDDSNRVVGEGMRSAGASAGNPAPYESMAVSLAACNAHRNDAQQRFFLNHTDSTVRSVASPDTCLTYGGYREANFYLARCEGWAVAGIGGQKWALTSSGSGEGSSSSSSSSGSRGSTRPGQQGLYTFSVLLNEEKCMDVFDCDPTRADAVQVCTCPGGADCYAQNRSCGTSNQRWNFDPTQSLEQGGAPISSDLQSGFGAEQAGQEQKGSSNMLCLTASALPHSSMNISMQVFVKKLSPLPGPPGGAGTRSEARAVVAFNRDIRPSNVTIRWEWLGWSPAAKNGAAVRDLWMHRDMGVRDGSFDVLVAPHAAVALRLEAV